MHPQSPRLALGLSCMDSIFRISKLSLVHPKHTPCLRVAASIHIGNGVRFPSVILGLTSRIHLIFKQLFFFVFFLPGSLKKKLQPIFLLWPHLALQPLRTAADRAWIKSRMALLPSKAFALLQTVNS